MQNKFVQLLKCDLTDTEIADAARDLARANSQKTAIESQKKEVDSQLKADIAAQDSIIARLSTLINTGHEYRNIDCRVELDTPDPGRKTVVRLDTGEIVNVKPMTDADRQMVMDLQTAAEAAEAEAKQQEPIITPPPVLQALPAPEVMSAAEVAEEDGAPLAAAHLVGGTHQKKRKGKEAAAGE